MKHKNYSVAALFALFVMASLATGVAAMGVSITQSGADNDEVMKDRTFTMKRADGQATARRRL